LGKRVIKKIEQNISHFISNQQLLQRGEKLLIALSGGPDSVFALHFFHKFKSKFGIDIAAMHINHQLRGENSTKDELFCEALCDKLNIEFTSQKIDVKVFAKKEKQSIEEAARNLRYEKLQKYFDTINATKIVTAHNLEDNTETVLLNLFRGSGLKGAGGIPIVRDNIIRPFLSTSKKDILEYLATEKIEYRIDATNFESDFSRNFLRNEIIPKLKEKINSGIDNNIFNFSQIANQSKNVINNFATDICDKFIIKNEYGITISDLIAEDSYKNIFPNALLLGLEKEFNKSFTFEDLSKLKLIFSLQVGSKVELSNNVVAIREREFVLAHFQRENNIRNNFKLSLNKECKVAGQIIKTEFIKKEDVQYISSPNIEFIAGDNLSFPLTIRRWKEGDRFQPMGVRGTKTISDFLTDSKVKSFSKKGKLVLLNKEKIIWLVGYRIDESVKVKEGTKTILKLSVETEDK
jgi:tRNA(Ile)-lysidine synthase